MVKPQRVCSLLVGALFIGSQVQAFTTGPPRPSVTTARRSAATASPFARPLPCYTSLHAKIAGDNEEGPRSPWLLKRLRRLVPVRKGLLRRVKPISFAILTVISLDRMGSVGRGIQHNFFCPTPAFASAPLPALPKLQDMDMEGEALKARNRELTAKNQQELREMQARAREIEATQGEEARMQFEKEFQEDRQRQVEEKSANIEQLKRDLYDQGISPVHELEGQRQVTLLEKDIDLAEVQGTRHYAEKINQKRYPSESEMVRKRPHHFILKNRVEDLKRRGQDPLEHFKRTKEDARILDMSSRKALSLEQEYKENLEKYGQITVPVAGEQILSREEFAAMQAQKASVGTSKEDLKAKAKEEKAAAKAKAKEEKAAAKAKAKEEKAVAKAKAKEEKARAKEEKAKAKEAVAAAAAAAAGAAAATATTAAQSVGDAVAAGVDMATPSTGGVQDAPIVAESSEIASEGEVAVAESAGAKEVEAPSKSKGGGSNIPIVPVATFVVAAGGGGYGFKVYRDKAALAEEERQRQFKLIMGVDDDDDSPVDGDDTGSPWSAPALEVDTDLTDIQAKDADEDTSPDTPGEPPVVEQPKKRKLGIKSMFSKKKSDRETHLNVVLAPTSPAPEFASLLAKILTFGAPGRFPHVVSLPGGMPMDKFDFEASKEKLMESRTTAGLNEEASAEVFGNVVNCMLIDIVDLASSTLKEKNDKITVDAINVVVDFMNHAASLYDSVAPGVELASPVVYGGTLGKGKLEQMFGKYAVYEGVDQDRLSLLQGVFSISDKKVEGIMMKDFRKKMMDMMKGMKDGEVPPEMQEMMGNMGGLEGLAGMEGMDGMDGMDMSPQQAKEMLKSVLDMKEAGLLPAEELEKVRQEFKSAFGAEIDEIMARAKEDESSLDADEREVMELMKGILED